MATAAASMAAAATSGKEFSWSQNQECACERDGNTTVHGYLHMKGGLSLRIGRQRSEGQSGDTLSFVDSVYLAEASLAASRNGRALPPTARDH
jgi:hypothetical protein